MMVPTIILLEVIYWKLIIIILTIKSAVSCCSVLSSQSSSWPGPSGIPGLNSNPVPQILENKISWFFGILSYQTKQWFLNYFFLQKFWYENFRLITSWKIQGSQDFAKSCLVPYWNSCKRLGPDHDHNDLPYHDHHQQECQQCLLSRAAQENHR